MRILRIDGRAQASNRDDMQTQVLIAQLPMLLHPGPVKDVMTVGLGSGVTAGSATVHPGVKVDCVEISPEVVEAGRRYFSRENHAVCERPDVARILVEDARSHLTFTDRTYDVIISEPSHVFISGMGDVFTREYYQACRARLREGGTMSQWVQAYWHTPEDVRTIVATFVSVFPRAWLFESMPSADYCLVGATGDVDFDGMERRWKGPVAEEMARIGFARPAHALAGLVAGPEELARFVRGARLMEDDTVHLEYSAPRALYQGPSDVLPSLAAMRAEVAPSMDWPVGSQHCRQAHALAVEAFESPDAPEDRLARVLPLIPDDPYARMLARQCSLQLAHADTSAAAEAARRFPDDPELAVIAGEAAFEERRMEDALSLLAAAAERFPYCMLPCHERAEVLRRMGRLQEANEERARARSRWQAMRDGRP